MLSSFFLSLFYLFFFFWSLIFRYVFLTKREKGEGFFFFLAPTKIRKIRFQAQVIPMRGILMALAGHEISKCDHKDFVLFPINIICDLCITKMIKLIHFQPLAKVEIGLG